MEKISKPFQCECLVFAERKVYVIIVRITMNALLEKRIEVMQTLLSMIEPMENEKGCRSCDVLLDIQDKNVFSLIEEWETRKDLDDHIKSNRFSVLLGTKSLLCELLHIEIHTVSHSEGMEAINSLRRNRSRHIP